MKNTKTEFRFFTVPEWKKEEEYLREKHKSGWKFVKVSGLGIYHFKKCEPKDVIYQLDYNPDSVNKKEEYIQIFNDCGWEYLQNYTGYSYFRKAACEMGGTEEEIFCDESSRMDMMKRVFKGRMIPLLIIFFFVIIPQLYIQSRMDDLINRVLAATFVLLLCLYLILFVRFAVSFYKYYKSV